MKIKNTKLSKRTLALLAATALLFGGGSYTGTKAALTYFSNDYTAEFSLDHLQVHLIENDVDVCHGNNVMTSVHRYDNGGERDKKYRGNLLEENLGYSFDPEDVEKHRTDAPAYTLGTPGKVAPGLTYTEKIGCKNGSNINQYVRLTIKKYWVKDGKKVTTLSPDLIKLTYDGKPYNSSDWTLNTKENVGSKETQTFYLNNVLKGGTREDGGDYSPLLFNELTIDEDVLDDANMTTETSKVKEGNKTITTYTYSYDYDGYTFYIEADVQAIQTHNVNDAIGALWGVSNVSAENGKVTVK